MIQQPRIPAHGLRRLTALLACAWLAWAHGATALPGDDWPMYRHDGQLTGRSPLKAAFNAPPAVAWSIDLHPTLAPTERARVADVDGDGMDEILVLRPDRILCMDRQGKTIWESAGLAHPTISDVRDFAGDGTRGILVWTDTGLERARYMLSGKTGHATRLYAMRNVFGSDERVGKIMPSVSGIQLCAWWSGEDRSGMDGDQSAYGYVFSFDKGVDAPVTRFSTNLTGMIFSPRVFFADYDEDGVTEMVMVSHQQAWMFDLSTGRQELYVKWPMIRTYSATLAMLPPVPHAKPALLSINPHIPGVERVDIVDGKAKVAWKQVVGPKEDQYQSQVKIAPGAPDPFLYLRNDGYLYILASVTNEHNDGENHLVIFDGEDGKRVFDESRLRVLCADDLDGDGIPELIIKHGNEIRIANWKDDHFVIRWHSSSAEPLLTSLPSEGDLARSAGGNTPVWREKKGSSRFLVRFPDGVFSCALIADGLDRGAHITVHAALGNLPNPHPPAEVVTKNGDRITVTKEGAETYHYDVQKAPRYLAPPAVVGDLGGARRVLVQDATGALFSYSDHGGDPVKLAEKVSSEWSICDMDGSGANVVVTAVTDAKGVTSCQFIAPDGKVLRTIDAIENAKSMHVGPSGSLGAAKGRWLVIFYDMKLGFRPCAAAYDGKTGAQLWVRDHFEKENSGYGPDAKVKFVLHLPTAVYDYDGNGTDDLLAASENFFGIIDVAANKLLTPIKVFSDYIPGHWQAYANPIVVPAPGKDRPYIFHHHAFAQTIMTKLDGDPIWHWGLTRDTTPVAWPGIADVHGDGVPEIAQSQSDGVVRVFDSTPLDQKCPRCPPQQPLTAMNHSGHVRWEMTVAPPVSDITTADLEGDGRINLLFGAGDGKLYAVGERDGHSQIKWAESLGAPIVGTPIIADLERDGQAEILVPVEDGRMLCLKPDHQTIAK